MVVEQNLDFGTFFCSVTPTLAARGREQDGCVCSAYMRAALSSRRSGSGCWLDRWWGLILPSWVAPMFRFSEARACHGQ